MTTVSSPTAPCLMQSAYKFKNGVNALFCTSESTGLSIFSCDENFQPFDKHKPSTRVARENMTQWGSMLEYHKWLRDLRKEDEFIKEHSTALDNLAAPNIVFNVSIVTAGTASITATTSMPVTDGKIIPPDGKL